MRVGVVDGPRLSRQRQAVHTRTCQYSSALSLNRPAQSLRNVQKCGILPAGRQTADFRLFTSRILGDCRAQRRHVAMAVMMKKTKILVFVVEEEKIRINDEACCVIVHLFL